MSRREGAQGHRRDPGPAPQEGLRDPVGRPGIVGGSNPLANLQNSFVVPYGTTFTWVPRFTVGSRKNDNGWLNACRDCPLPIQIKFQIGVALGVGLVPGGILLGGGQGQIL